MIHEAGITGFYPSREYYARVRITGEPIDAYILTAHSTIILVSINLMTGLPIDGLCNALRSKLEAGRGYCSTTVSLINPSRNDLMTSIAPVLELQPEVLRADITRSLDTLVRFRDSLAQSERSRLAIRAHNAVPFASAILLDHRTVQGRIQIETKAYKAPLRKSFGFEISPSDTTGLYNVLASGYEALLHDGIEWGRREC